ncbi:MAG TPA: MerR family transcriptional regulator [Dehalococcoidia bacterium]|nr:MerR family transcriptional regulator [Dehalococcoidia bacterium]
MRIGEAAKASGLSIDTIRFYERTGMLPAPPREANGYRRYTREHIETLRLAAGLRSLGVPLERVKPIVRVAHDATCADMRDALTAALAQTVTDIDRQIGQLTKLRGRLRSILEGLRRMSPEDATVPGLRACPCVPLVAADRRPRSAGQGG